jgi:molybdate transport repressor ModE-like protein
MHWDDLRYFLAVAQSGSIADAARELGVSYSTASRRLNILEEAIGARLFDRHASGYELTAAGREILQYAQSMASEFSQLSRVVIGRDKRLAGRLRFATTDALAMQFMPDLARFTREYPDIEVDLITTPAPAELAMRDAEAAMLLTNDPPEVLVGRRLARVSSALYASRHYLGSRTSVERLDAEAWVAWEHGMRHIPASQWMQKNVPNARVVCRVSTGVALLSAVRSGVGVAHLICPLADTDPDLRRIGEPEPVLETSLWLLTHEDLATTGRVRVFLDFIAEAMARDRRAFAKNGRA